MLRIITGYRKRVITKIPDVLSSGSIKCGVKLQERRVLSGIRESITKSTGDGGVNDDGIGVGANDIIKEINFCHSDCIGTCCSIGMRHIISGTVASITKTPVRNSICPLQIGAKIILIRVTGILRISETTIVSAHQYRITMGANDSSIEAIVYIKTNGIHSG